MGAAFDIAPLETLFPGEVPNWGIRPGVNTLGERDEVVE